MYVSTLGMMGAHITLLFPYFLDLVRIYQAVDRELVYPLIKKMANFVRGKDVIEVKKNNNQHY